MTTYRKDVKEQRALISADSYKVQNKLWERTNCLLGFTVISILIGCAALVISILLLLQSFEMAGLKNAKVADLEMRIKYLEHLTENLQPLPEDNNIYKPENVMGAPPPPPPQLPPQSPPTPPPTPPSPQPQPDAPNQSRPNEISRKSEETKPEELLPVGNDEKDEIIVPEPIDDEDSYGGFEGSGDDCPVNPPVPVCPMAMRICKTKERCPKYICCN